ncbi:MAG: AzlD domain-containing protein [Kiritimatiellae bacterium]|nr:AzlD domain-containing protein [Kiritimatiellia bacterium]
MESNRILYLIALVAAGWGVTYALRSLPFALFSRKARELPPWVGRLGILISPVIIAFLIVYSYTSLEWRTLGPYLAGAVTVALQLFWRNPLISIIAGTTIYMIYLR